MTTLDVADCAKQAITRVPLEFSSDACQIRLELAPGATAVQVIVREDDTVAAWIEVSAQPGEQVTVEFRRDADGGIRAFSRHKQFLFLTGGEPPAPALIAPPHTEELDLAILVDGTCLHPSTGTAGGLSYLLGPETADVWKSIVDGIARFVAQISAKYPKLWATAMAFGDEPGMAERVADPRLKPKYLIYPPSDGSRKMQAVTGAQLAADLCKLPATPGGDFVDALADGLHTCASLAWRQRSRKLILVFGQSPGYSVLESAGDMTDLLVRKLCMEQETAALHQQGVEIVTVFHEPPEARDRYSNQVPAVLWRAREQYCNLASLRAWSCTETDRELGEIAEKWLEPPGLIARGPCPGAISAEQ